jgi:hypothetical protein
MPTLSASVGDAAGTKGVNKRHDVALVQVLLMTAKDPKTDKPYFGPRYDGTSVPGTVAAIKAFQESWKLASPPTPPTPAAGVKGGTPTAGKPGAVPPAPAPTPPAPASTEKYGLIEPTSATFKKLVEEAVKVNADFTGLRAPPDTKVLYLEGSDHDLQARRKEIADSGLEATFMKAVLALVDAMFNTHKVVLGGWNTKDSFLRSFSDQHQSLASKTSPLHPGESLHQYGRGMDVGWRGLVWIQDDGKPSTINNADDWDTLGHKGYWRQNAFYDARNKIWESPPRGTGTIYKIATANDPDHFQAYSQEPGYYPKTSTVNLFVSLAALLTKVSADRGDKMKWEAGSPDHNYSCDLGLGGTPIGVGTADVIWQGHATLKKDQYVKALNETRAKTKQPPLKEADVKDGDFDKVFKALKQAFDDAEKDGTTKWVALDNSGTAI